MRRGGIARVRRRATSTLEHANAERATTGFLHELGLAEPHLRGELAAIAHDDLGRIGARGFRELDRELRGVAVLDGRFGHPGACAGLCGVRVALATCVLRP